MSQEKSKTRTVVNVIFVFSDGYVEVATAEEYLREVHRITEDATRKVVEEVLAEFVKKCPRKGSANA